MSCGAKLGCGVVTKNQTQALVSGSSQLRRRLGGQGSRQVQPGVSATVMEVWEAGGARDGPQPQRWRGH